MRPARLALLAAAGIALGASFAVLAGVLGQAAAPPQSRGLVSSTGTADIGGPFSLIDETGARVSEADLTGRPTALFFGFTWCPDVCPTTLFEVTSLMERLGPDADRMNFVMVTVDPERDTPEILNEYLSAFDARLRGFTGTPAEVAAMTDAYRVQVERVATENGYTMNHTASVFLMDAENRFAGTITYHEDPETALAKLRRLIGAA